MDFRAMLKKKKYAKWGNDDGGPDWGNLKEVPQDQDPGLKKVEKVGIILLHSNIIKYLEAG